MKPKRVLILTLITCAAFTFLSACGADEQPSAPVAALNNSENDVTGKNPTEPPKNGTTVTKNKSTVTKSTTTTKDGVTITESSTTVTENGVSETTNSTTVTQNGISETTSSTSASSDDASPETQSIWYTEVVPPRYDYAESFSEGLALVRAGNKWGFIDKSGNEVIPLQYDRANSFSDGVAAVNLYGRWGLIDTSGNEVLPFILEYSRIDSFHEGIAAFNAGYVDVSGYVDKTGKEIFPIGEYQVKSTVFSDGIVKVKVKNKDKYFDGNHVGYIDKNGNLITSNVYQSGGDFHEGLAYVSDGRRSGYIDTSGNEVIPLIYGTHSSWGRNFSEGLAAVKDAQLSKYGFLDKNGNTVIQFKYTDVGDFSEGMAWIKLFSNKYGYIDRMGNEVIPCMYDSVYNYSDGMAFVELDGKYGFIDKTGKELSPFVELEQTENYEYTIFSCYDNNQSFERAVCIEKKPVNSYERKYGFFTKDGLVVTCIYDEASEFSEGLALVKRDGKYGFIKIND